MNNPRASKSQWILNIDVGGKPYIKNKDFTKRQKRKIRKEGQHLKQNAVKTINISLFAFVFNFIPPKNTLK